MSNPSLTPAQTHALFDILIHHQLYEEIEAHKYPNAIKTYGYPFRKEDGVQTTAPLLQNMLNKFGLQLPGLTNVSLEFWQDKVGFLVEKLGAAELSESYDKGAIGARKALATACSSLLEYVARGFLGGYAVKDKKAVGQRKEYDTSKSEDILRAWDDAVREAIYGDFLEETFKKAGETGKLEDHTSLLQAAHEYILLNLASFLHHVFVVSPDGQYILRLLENVHRLVPYYLVKQTLRVGNAATMINGMVKLVLTKISVTAVTNWMGLTNNSNDGMNLMQQIISTVMAWDTSEFQKRAQKLESQRDAPDKKAFKAIKSFVYASRDKHEAARSISIQESKSIICVILETAEPAVSTSSLNDHQHDIAMEYYSNLLSIRDREELTKIFCKLQPDVLTSSMRDLVAAFDPIIRGVHNAVDLSETVDDAENFIGDLVKISKPRRNNGKSSRPVSRNNSRSTSPTPVPDNPPASLADAGELAHAGIPTVEDYVQLLRKHAPSSHKFMHQVCQNAPDLRDQYLEYAKACAAEFRVHDAPNIPEEEEGAAGTMTDPLHSIFSSLSSDQQNELKDLLDQHENHLQKLKSTSQTRLETIMNQRPGTSSSTNGKPPPQSRGSTHGPGIYLSRWNALLDCALITPATLHGRVRHGWEVKGELDGQGLKTGSLLNRSNGDGAKGKDKDKASAINMADGRGDAVERHERKRDGKEDVKTERVWSVMKDGWVGVCRGLEVMGTD